MLTVLIIKNQMGKKKNRKRKINSGYICSKLIEVEREKVTATVADGGGRDVAGGGQRQCLGDVQRHAQLGAVPEGLAQTRGASLQHRLQAGAACSLRLRRRASGRHERQAVGHV